MNRDHIFLMLMGNRSVRFGLSLFDLAVLAAAVAAVAAERPAPITVVTTPDTTSRLTLRSCLVGFSIMANLAIALLVAAVIGATYLPRISPVIPAVAYEANDAGTSADSYLKWHALQLLLPSTVVALLLLTFARSCFLRLTSRSGRVCPALIPPTGHSSTVHSLSLIHI